MATVSFTSGDLLGADETAEYTAASSHCESAVTPSSSSPRMGAVGVGVPPAAAAAWAWAAAAWAWAWAAATAAARAAAAWAAASPLGIAPCDCDGVIICDAPDVPSLGSFAAERARRSFADANVLGAEAAAPPRLVGRETDASAADDSPSAASSV